MTKGTLISLVRNILAGGVLDQNEASLHPELIASYATACITEMMASVEEEDRGPFLKSYPSLEIKNDTVRDERYIDIPEPIIPIPGNIHTVAPDQDRKNPWPIVNAGEMAVYCNLDVSTCLPVAYLEGGKVFLSGVGSHTKTALLTLLPSVEVMEDDEDLPVPHGMEKTLVDLVIERFGMESQVPEDITNDNSSQ